MINFWKNDFSTLYMYIYIYHKSPFCKIELYDICLRNIISLVFIYKSTKIIKKLIIYKTLHFDTFFKYKINHFLVTVSLFL